MTKIALKVALPAAILSMAGISGMAIAMNGLQSPPEEKMSQEAPPAPPENPSATEGSVPAPTIDTNEDGVPDAWDRDANGVPDAWDVDGDNKPDLLDNDGDGRPDGEKPAPQPDEPEEPE